MGWPTFQLNERDAQQKPIPVAPRNEYVVIRYIEPLFGNERALGFDIASDPVRREAFEWARDKGEARATKQTNSFRTRNGSWLRGLPANLHQRPFSRYGRRAAAPVRRICRRGFSNRRT